MFEELRNACRPGMVGGFLPGMKQIANVAALPGINSSHMSGVWPYYESNQIALLLNKTKVMLIQNLINFSGIVGRSVGLPDVHSGYGFAIGNMAAFDMEVKKNYKF